MANGRDPVITALIEALPPPGTEWPAAARAAWLKMMAMSIEIAYRAPSGELQKPPRGRPSKKAKDAKAEPAFYIDKNGFARKAGGARINAKDVGGYIVDLRGERGDLAAIVWADDSSGVPKGTQLDITAG